MGWVTINGRHVLIGDGHDGTHDPATETGNTTTDNAVVNVPLAKRGDLNAQIDKWKRGEVAAQRAQSKINAQQRKLARSLYAEHGLKMVERYGPKFGQKEITHLLEQQSKWEPNKFINLVEKFKAGK